MAISITTIMVIHLRIVSNFLKDLDYYLKCRRKTKPKTWNEGNKLDGTIKPTYAKSSYEIEFERTKFLNREELVKMLCELKGRREVSSNWQKITNKSFFFDERIPGITNDDFRAIIADIKSYLKTTPADKINETATAQDKTRFRGRQKGRAYKSFLNH